MIVLEIKSKKHGIKNVFIDGEDFDKIKNYTRHLSKKSNSFYVVGRIKNGIDKTDSIKMHRIILDAPKGLVVDHINHNILDNRKINLRLCNNTENIRNSRKTNKIKTSEYKGVSWDKKRNKFRAAIGFNNKQVFIGRFETEKEASIAYNNKALELFGEFACLNKI